MAGANLPNFYFGGEGYVLIWILVTDKDSVVINKLGHDWGEWVVKKTAAETTPGQKERTCNRCGQKETETIPATGSGTIITEVKREENAPAISISTPTEEVEDMLLTEVERQQAQNETDIRIVLEVQDAGNTVSDSDKTAVERALNDMTVGGYLNIQLYKLVGDKRTDITETAEKIKIVIATSGSLKNTDGNMTWTFAVIRVHGGRAEILPDLDNSDNGDNNNSNNNGDSDNNSNDNHSGKNDAKPNSSKDGEPRTGRRA